MSFSGGSSVSVDEILEEVLRCKPLFFDGGGVTFTGGECTCQFENLQEVLCRLKKEGIHTAIETNGTSPRLQELFNVVDTLIMDCKHYDPEIHRRFTGMSNEQTLINVARAFALHPDLLIRIPLIGGFNASEKDMLRFADLFSAYDTGRARFELLPYHEYGKDKWAACGKTYTVHDAFVSEEDRKRFETILRDRGLQVVRT